MKINSYTVITVILLAVGMMLSACNTASGTLKLEGTSWSLVSYGPKDNQTPAAAGVETSLVFGTDGQISGNMGCNGFGGKYEVKDGVLTFSEVISTMMACEEPRMTQEISSFQVLNGTTSYELSSGTLTITDASGTISITLASIPAQEK